MCEGDRLAHRAAVEHAHEVRRLPARQVDEIGLTDRLRCGGVVGRGAVAHEDRLDLGAELTEMRDTHRGPAGEDLLAVRVRRRRQDRHPRPRTPGRGEQAGIELQHRG